MNYFVGKAQATVRKRNGRWFQRVFVLLFAGILIAHVAVVAIWHPILIHDRKMAKLKIGDTRETMIRLVGEPRWSKSIPQFGTVCEFSVFPWLMTEDYRNYRFRRKWRIVLDDSGRIVSKTQLNPNGC